MVSCPQCTSQRLWKDGLRKTPVGEVQRHLCRECGYRFSEKTIIKPSSYGSTCQICVSHVRKAKNLTRVEPLRERLAGATKQDAATIKGKIIDFLWWAEKQGYAKDTIRGFGSCLRALLQRDADLFDLESVKEALAMEKKWSHNRRRNVINTYTTFLRFNDMKWDKPKCRVERKIPFIPMEKEIDASIAGSNKKLAAFLQLPKETAM